jgi:ATP-binding cassette subfamily F protein 3
MIAVNNLSIHFSGDYLFDAITFLINDRDRIGLVGKNGAGKSTLLKIISGHLEPESGTISSPSGNTIGYLPQEMIIRTPRTVMNEALLAFSELLNLEKLIVSLTTQLSEREDYDSPEYYKLIERLHESNERHSLLGGNTKEADTEKILLGLGFEHTDFNRKVSEFSGGWQMRIELAKILLRRPDVILLDEPTNHLDIESIQWLEDFLKSYPGSVMLVSHDRAFLDNVTNRTIEITLGKIFDFKCSYSDYVEQRATIRENQMNAFANQQKEIAEMERFIERFRYKATKAKQAQSRIKLLDKMERVEIDGMDASSIHFRFPPAPHSGKVTVEAEGLSKSYGEKLVLKDLNFMIEKGEFIAFVGRNGEGKSTLARIIIGDLDYTGIYKLGHNVKIGYYAQNQAMMLDPERTVFETIDDVATGDMRPRVRSLLGQFLFGGETIDKKVKVLSGGEKSRLALAKLLLEPVNLLVLDEPTNHLDMQSKDILKSALLQYDGTMVVVSHDRDFLQGLTDKVWEFKNHTIKVHVGDVYEFLATRKLETLKQLEIKTAAAKLAGEDTVSVGKQDYERRKLIEKEARKVRSQIEKQETLIEELEAKIAAIDAMLADPYNHSEKVASGELFQEYEAFKQQLEEAMHHWETLHVLLEEVQDQI